MNAQIEIGREVEKPTKWQIIQRWILAFDGGFNYDPTEFANNAVRALLQKVKEIEARLVELESVRKS